MDSRVTDAAPQGPLGPFVGRARELKWLSDAVGSTLAGRGALVLVAGEPGIGKTRLAAELAQRAIERDVVVCWGRCWESAGAPAFWPWMQVVRACLQGASPDERRADLGRAAADIARVIPEAATDQPPPQSLGLRPEEERFRFFDGLTLFLKATSRRRPLLLVFDDLQWADPPSLLLLEFVARELGDTPLMVAATYRDTDLHAAHPLRTTLGALVRATECTHATLSGFDGEEIQRYVGMVAGQPPSARLVTALERHTEGNPFFLREVVQLLAAAAERPIAHIDERELDRLGLPSGVRDAISRRLEPLPHLCRALLSVAAVIGREFDLERLAAVSRADRPNDARSAAELHAALEPALERGLLLDGERLAFAHALIRETLYAETPPARRAALHRRVADTLEATYGKRDTHAAEIAHHFAAAGASADAARYARRAGHHAMAHFAYEAAVHAYRAALEQLPAAAEPERCDLLLALGEAEIRAGEPTAARETSFRAAELGRQLGLGDHLASAALGFGWHFDAGVIDHQRIALLKEALDILDPGDGVLRAKVMARLAVAIYFVPDSYASRAALSAEAVRMARGLGDAATLAFVINARLYALWVPADTGARLELARELLQLAERCGDDELTLQSRHWLVMDLIECGQIDAGLRHVEAHAALASRLRQPLYLWFAAMWRATLAVMQGRFADAEVDIPRAYELGARAEPANAEQTAMTQMFFLRLEQGRVGELVAGAEAWRVEGAFDAAQACGRALLFAEAERPEAMQEELDYLRRLGLQNIPRDAGWLTALAALAMALARFPDAALAREVHDLLLPFRTRIALAGMLSSCYAAISHHLGVLAGMLSDWTAAEAHFRDALATHQRLGARPLIARTQHEWAAMLVARDAPGDRDHADELLERAIDTARELGMDALRDRAAALRAAIATGAATPYGP